MYSIWNIRERKGKGIYLCAHDEMPGIEISPIFSSAYTQDVRFTYKKKRKKKKNKNANEDFYDRFFFDDDTNKENKAKRRKRVEKQVFEKLKKEEISYLRHAKRA